MSSVIPITLRSERQPRGGYLFKQGSEFVPEMTINFPVNSDRRGEFRCWIKLDGVLDAANVVINSGLDKNVVVEMTRNAVPRLDRWISVCIDDLAVEVLQVSQRPRDKVFQVGLRTAMET